MDTSSSTPKDAKIRVDKATKKLAKSRCLITNVECDAAVDYAHVLGCAVGSKEAVMDRLEYSWDMGWRTQNIHSRHNIFRLSAKFHHLFDANKWLLLPETHIVDKYEGALNTWIFPEVKEKVYKYKLVAHPDMKQVPIHRRIEEPGATSPGAFEKFVYPFEEFPVIVSHVHPRFVICDVGYKLADIVEFFAYAEGKAEEVYDMLRKIIHIYHVWGRDTPENRFYEDKNEPRLQPGNVKPDREGTADVSCAKFSASSTPPTPRPRNRRRPFPVAEDESVNGQELDDYPISDKAKVIVDKAAAKRCLIDSTDESNALDYAHLVPRDTEDILTSLEYSWRMRYNSLNVDTHRNVFRLSRTFHRLFNRMAWLLLPEKGIIERYYEVKDDPDKFPMSDSPTYRYTLIVNKIMEHIPIHVQQNKPSVSKDGGDMTDHEEAIQKLDSSDNIDFNLEDAFATHTYPFHHFPTILSHVHPRFVICNAGAKMADAVSAMEFIAANPLEGDILLKVLEIYEAWKEKCSLSDFHTAGTLYLDTPSDEIPDDQTEPRRIPPSPKAKRPRPTPSDGDGSRKAKRVKSGGGKDSPWLDGVTLGELEPDRSPQEAWQEKAARIQTWVGQIPLDLMEQIPLDVDAAEKSAPDQCHLDSEDMNSVLSACR